MLVDSSSLLMLSLSLLYIYEELIVELLTTRIIIELQKVARLILRAMIAAIANKHRRHFKSAKSVLLLALTISMMASVFLFDEEEYLPTTTVLSSYGDYNDDEYKTDLNDDEYITTDRRHLLAESDVIIKPYNLIDTIEEANMFDSAFAILVYDPPTDKFIAYMPEQHGSEENYFDVRNLISLLNMIRIYFPERFRGLASQEFTFPIAFGVRPHTQVSKLPHTSGKAPVLVLGSVFRDETLYPNLIPLPKPGLHLNCFEQWAITRTLCPGFQYRSDQAMSSRLLSSKYDIDLGLSDTDVILVEEGDNNVPPGLLFRRLTDDQDDYILHKHLKPMEHYIPIQGDLSDLQEKLAYAQNQVDESKLIADQASRFFQNIGIEEGFIEWMFKQDFVRPMRRVIKAYEPVSNYIDIIESLPDGNKMIPVLECSYSKASGSSCTSPTSYDKEGGTKPSLFKKIAQQVLPSTLCELDRKPIMHTFFEPIEKENGSQITAGSTDQGHQDLINVWKESWESIGFETKVLTREDALKHPDFFYYSKRLLKLGVSEYNQRCFWRWMAMGALNGDCQNGGWMSDYDTFPLNFTVEEAKEIEKKPGFKSFNMHTPNFLHSDAQHWNKMIRKLIRPPIQKVRKAQILSDVEKTLVTDMLMLRDVQKTFGNEELGITVWERESPIAPQPLSMLYDSDEKDETKLVVNCEKAKLAKVEHISHMKTTQLLLKYPELRGDLTDKHSFVRRRPWLAQKMMRDFQSCREQ